MRLGAASACICLAAALLLAFAQNAAGTATATATAGHACIASHSLAASCPSGLLDEAQREGPAGSIDYEAEFERLLSQSAGELQGLALMKEVERLSFDIFRHHPAFASGGCCL